MLLTGEDIDGATAERWGFVEFVTDPADLSATVQKTVSALCEAAPKAVRDQKALMRQWEDAPLDDAIEAGVRASRRPSTATSRANIWRRFAPV